VGCDIPHSDTKTVTKGIGSRGKREIILELAELGLQNTNCLSIEEQGLNRYSLTLNYRTIEQLSLVPTGLEYVGDYAG
jgi:hypothetical protein